MRSPSLVNKDESEKSIIGNSLSKVNNTVGTYSLLRMNDPDEILKKHWLKKGSVRVGNVVASGGYGTVYRGWYGNLKVAIKDYRLNYDELNQDDRMDIMEEFQLMKDLNHTNTVRVYGFILHHGCLALVMEYATRGSLKRFIQKKSLKSDPYLQYHILLQIASAMRFIHSENILHRDLKPDNVLVFQDKTSSFTLKITDFGEARRIDTAERSLTFGKGTFTYMDPAAARQGNNKATDFYSFCVLALEVLTGEFIPKITTLDDLLKRDRPIFPESIPNHLRSHLSSGFEDNQEERSSWTDVIIALQQAMDMEIKGKSFRRKNLSGQYSVDVGSIHSNSNSNSWFNRLKRRYLIWAVIISICIILPCVAIPLALRDGNNSFTTFTTPLPDTSSSLPPPLPNNFSAKLLVATGYVGNDDKEGFELITEVIDLANPSVICTKWANVDDGVGAAVGGLTSEGLMVCSGSPIDLSNGKSSKDPEDPSSSNKCFLITETGIELMPELDLGTAYSAGVVVDDFLFITGGDRKRGEVYTNRTEYVWNNTHTFQGPNLPTAVAAHCIVKLSDDQFVLTGGRIGNGSLLDKTWYFSRNLEKWTLGPNMSTSRFNHACGSFVLNGERIVVVAGAGNDNANKSTVEFLSQNQWRQGPDLPESYDLRGHQIVSQDDVLFYINTKDNAILLLECEMLNDCKWTQLPQKLEFIRKQAVIALIPEERSNCTES